MRWVFSFLLLLTATASLLLLPAGLGAPGGVADAMHTDVFIVSLSMKPSTPFTGQRVELTTVITNLADVQKDVNLSFALDGIWVIDDISLDMPARKSAAASIKIPILVEPGEHRLKACPDRAELGNDGDQCETLDFTVVREASMTVAIISPTEGEVLRGTVEVEVVAMGQTAESVSLYIQGDTVNQLVDVKSGAPFVFNLDTTEYPDGSYDLYAMANFESGRSDISERKEYTISNSPDGANLVLRVKPGILQEAQAMAGRTLEIGSSITNAQNIKIAATLIVLIKDSEGYTEHISWKEDGIRPGETKWLSRSWAVEESGEYSVEVFLWDTITNPVPLTGVMKAHVVAV